MPIFLTCAFLLALYLLGVQLFECLPGVRLSRTRLYVALLPAALILVGSVILIASSLGSWDEVLMFTTVLGLAAAGYAIVMDFRRFDAAPMAITLFALAVLAVGFITLFSRDGTSSTKVLFGLSKFAKAIQTGSLLPLKHNGENLLLFMPFGFGLAACLPGKPRPLLRIGVYALVFSAAIESFQYLLFIGECDLEDVLSNVFGAWAGFGAYRLFLRTR